MKKSKIKRVPPITKPGPEGLRLLYAALLLEGECHSNAADEAAAMAPLAVRYLQKIQGRDPYNDVHAFLADVAVKNSAANDLEEGLPQSDRDGCVARAGFHLGIAVAFRMMTAIGGVR